MSRSLQCRTRGDGLPAPWDGNSGQRSISAVTFRIFPSYLHRDAIWITGERLGKKSGVAGLLLQSTAYPPPATQPARREWHISNRTANQAARKISAILGPSIWPSVLGWLHIRSLLARLLTRWLACELLPAASPASAAALSIIHRFLF